VYGTRTTAPSTRMGNLRGQREAFLAAQAYERRWTEWKESQPDEGEDSKSKKKKKQQGGNQGHGGGPPERDLDLETLVGVMNGRILAQVHCYRADDMLSMLQVADEFGFQVRSFHHATEAYKVRDVLASRNVSASIWADWWGFKLEAYDAVPEGAALIAETGGRAVIHSDSGVGIQRLNQEAAKAFAAGVHAGVNVTEEDALRWVTANPAWTLGIDGETGTLEVGKRGDVVVWSGHPFSVYSRPDLVFVGGVLRYDHDRPRVWSDFSLGQEVVP
jgi:imidazolonepropionase-like amidohydrolase